MGVFAMATMSSGFEPPAPILKRLIERSVASFLRMIEFGFWNSVISFERRRSQEALPGLLASVHSSKSTCACMLKDAAEPVCHHSLQPDHVNLQWVTLNHAVTKCFFILARPIYIYIYIYI